MSRITCGPAAAALLCVLVAGCAETPTSMVPHEGLQTPIVPSLGLTSIPMGSVQAADVHRFRFDVGPEVDQVGAAQLLPARNAWLLTQEALYASDPHQEGNVPLTPTIAVHFTAEAQSRLGLGPSKIFKPGDQRTEYITGDDGGGWRQRFFVRELETLDPPWIASHVTGFDADRLMEDRGGGIQRVIVSFTPRDTDRFGALATVPPPRGEVRIFGDITGVSESYGWDWDEELSGIRFSGPVVVGERHTFVVDLRAVDAAHAKPRVEVRLISENGLPDRAVPNTDAVSIDDGTLGTATYSSAGSFDLDWTRILQEEWIASFAGRGPLQGIVAALEALIALDPAAPPAAKLRDAVAKAEVAIEELRKQPPDKQAAVGNIEGAVGELEAAVIEGLDPVVGDRLMNGLAAAARRLARAAIDDAVARGGDSGKIATALDSLTQGDALRAAGGFKDAVNKYKDALSNAEGA